MQFNVETPKSAGMKVYTRDSGHNTQMVIMSIIDKPLLINFHLLNQTANVSGLMNVALRMWVLTNLVK